MNESPRIMIIAGEISGDMHAADLVTEFRKLVPSSSFFGIGGERMRSAGVTTHHDISDMAVMGFTEVLKKFSFFRRVFYEMMDLAEREKPDAVILVDYPGFNLRLAAKTHEMGIKTIYYICPQVWAWHQSRIKTMSRVIDLLITIFPFEKKFFESSNMKVEFAGHPLLDKAANVMKAPETVLPWDGTPRVALLPGSREHEIQRLLPDLWNTAGLLQNRYSTASFIIPAPSDGVASIIRKEIKKLPAGPSRWAVTTGQTYEVLRQARAAIVASGTATIDTALMLCPMVVTYRTALMTYILGRMLVKVDHIGMVNLVAGQGICPEFIQGQVTPSSLCKALIPLIDETPERSAMLQNLKQVRKMMGPGNASKEAANIVRLELSH